MKKNLRKIPDDILTKLKTIKDDEIVVGCAVKVKAEHLATGKLVHLGVVLSLQGLQLPTTVIPPANQGKYSSYNVEGIEIVRKDLPKETHYNAIESPNWGDSYNGTHTVYLPYEKYPREFHSPRELEISMACKEVRSGLSAYVIVFQVKEVLSKKAKDFSNKLFENLNLLQENAGACGVESAGIAMEEYAKSLHVSWDILPPGTLDDTIQRLFHGQSPSVQEKDVATERYNFFMSLKPKNLVFGNSGFRRYFGALLEDDLVVFENIQYGNAIYVLFDDWETLSKRSRIELISGKYGTAFERIIHAPGWKSTLKKLVATKRAEKKKK
jgi:hypothetical protein